MSQKKQVVKKVTQGMRDFVNLQRARQIQRQEPTQSGDEDE